MAVFRQTLLWSVQLEPFPRVSALDRVHWHNLFPSWVNLFHIEYNNLMITENNLYSFISNGDGWIKIVFMQLFQSAKFRLKPVDMTVWHQRRPFLQVSSGQHRTLACVFPQKDTCTVIWAEVTNKRNLKKLKCLSVNLMFYMGKNEPACKCERINLKIITDPSPPFPLWHPLNLVPCLILH